MKKQEKSGKKLKGEGGMPAAALVDEGPLEDVGRTTEGLRATRDLELNHACACVRACRCGRQI